MQASVQANEREKGERLCEHSSQSQYQTKLRSGSEVNLASCLGVEKVCYLAGPPTGSDRKPFAAPLCTYVKTVRVS